MWRGILATILLGCATLSSDAQLCPAMRNQNLKVFVTFLNLRPVSIGVCA
jgi:hypothetical protein